MRAIYSIITVYPVVHITYRMVKINIAPFGSHSLLRLQKTFSIGELSRQFPLRLILCITPYRQSNYLYLSVLVAFILTSLLRVRQ